MYGADFSARRCDYCGAWTPGVKPCTTCGELPVDKAGKVPCPWQSQHASYRGKCPACKGANWIEERPG